MSVTEEHIDRRNDTLTIVGDTYCVHMNAFYVTTIDRKDSRQAGELCVGVHMTEEEARALLAGLQEALA
jgi:hypothetical protein